MGLKRYREKRDFRITPEPRGRAARQKSRGLSFVIQKHAAGRLHYDFRLELDGVLLSWAVPKGPSLDPRDKRLAVHVEDHPLEYGGFEGIIPPRQYGAGTVMLWDRGTWTPEGDARAGYAKGHLKFQLDGEKLHGGWSLIRTRGSKYAGKGDNAWLLIKERDEFAQTEPIVEEAPDSVVSGRTLDEIARDPEHEWHSNRPVKENVRAGALGAGTKAPAKRQRSAPATGLRLDKKAADVVRERAAPKSAAVEESAAGSATDKSANNVFAGVKLSNPDKPYFPEAGLAKRDIARYYVAIAERILPHVRGRPLSLVRCPDGWKGQCFYQKHADKSVHRAVARVEVPEGGGKAMYFSAGSLSALIGLVQWGVIELHPWGSCVPRLDRPDRLIFDFDPGDGVDWSSIVDAAVLFRALLDDVNLTGFLKTTGGKGLHVVVPIKATLTWEEAKTFTRTIAELLARTFPDRFTATASKSHRSGKIYIDYLRNAEGATAIAPYGIRARENAPVSTPIAWEELDDDVRFDRFNVRNVPARLDRLKVDPWANFQKTSQAVTKAMWKRVGDLKKD